MPLFPLDSVRNLQPGPDIELVLEEIRAELAAFQWPDGDLYTIEDVLGVFDLARPRMNILAEALRSLPDARGADISTGFGFLPILLRRYGLHAVATERDTSLGRFAAAQGIDIRDYVIGRQEPPFEADSLDFVVFAEVLEHLKFPAVHVVQALAALLRPGGVFMLTTPNIARLDHIETLAAGENFLETFPEALPRGADATDYLEHVREYSVREAVEAVEASGLSIDWVGMTGWGEAGYDPLPNPFVNEIVVVRATK